MTRWYSLEPLDEGFFDSAPFRYRYPMDLPVPAERVWAGLTGSDPLSWCRLLSEVRYTSDRPFGVGTTRTATVLRGSLRIRERFITWDEGRRHAFLAEEANLPVFRRFGEDYLVEPTATGCRFTWTFAFEPNPALRLAFRAGAPLNRALYATFARDTRRHFGAR
ncbi:polyketide cyclase [Longimycelium tulufanense]|uniref:Polyketide cyclase n=1 Tax=Longimycelium tulufanense TaxID=907463 RepID=A0A8J3C7U7_9PSEU|nr:SRPBCC family protein [Longimycelium tulufanense]GGM37651.1 polyketide cyclase [Longimycelium tulufanense]